MESPPPKKKNLQHKYLQHCLQLIQYKSIHRYNITPDKMFQMRLVDANICSQCARGHINNSMDATWACHPIYSFWTAVTENLDACLDHIIPVSPPLFLLGDTTQILQIPLLNTITHRSLWLLERKSSFKIGKRNSCTEFIAKKKYYVQLLMILGMD